MTAANTPAPKATASVARAVSSQSPAGPSERAHRRAHAATASPGTLQAHRRNPV